MRNHTRKIHSRHHKKSRKIRGGAGFFSWIAEKLGFKKPEESSSDINSNGSSAAREITSQSQPTTAPTTTNATQPTTPTATNTDTNQPNQKPPNMGGKRRRTHRRRH